MKKILLLFMVLMAVTMVSANQNVIFKGEKATGNWSWNTDRHFAGSLFADLTTGDVLWVKVDINEAEAIAAKEEYYQLTVSIAKGSPYTDIVSGFDVKVTKYWCSAPLTAEQVADIKTYGIYVGGHFVTVKDIAYGADFSTTAVQHWDGSAWSSDPYVLSSDKDTWANKALNGDQLTKCHVGDCIIVNYTTTAENEWDARVCLYQGYPWTTLYDYPAGSKSSVTLYIDQTVYDAINSANGVQLGGCNYSVTSIILKTTKLYYGLNAANNLVSLSDLNTQTVNVSLTRKFDWEGTICLPFDVANLSAFPEGVKVYEFKEYNSGLVFTEREHIEAGVPYYMKRPYDENVKEEEKYQTISFDDVTINNTLNNSETSAGLTFKGNFTSSMSMTGKYGMAWSSSESSWGFYKGGENTYLPAYGAYFEGSLSAARLSIIIEEDATSLNTVKIEDLRDKSYFNLNGQRVAQPTKGLYIVNGKKVVIK